MSNKDKNIGAMEPKEHHKCLHKNKNHYRAGQYAQILVWTCKACNKSGTEEFKMCVIL